MEETRNLVLEIANRLYDLDAEVYRVLGSAWAGCLTPAGRSPSGS